MEEGSFTMETLITMIIESPKTTISKSSEEVFTMLTDVRYFRTLMPDNIAEFEILGEGKFLFALKGMPQITLQLKEKYPSEKIVYEAANGKVPFTLTLYINETASVKSEVQFIFQAEFNAMMAMMIKTPISNFIGTLSKNMVKL